MNDTQALTRIEPMPAVAVTPSVEAMITLAIERGATVDTLERLMAIRREVRQEQAKQAFTFALKQFQAECPVIPKKCVVKNKDGSVRYRYADLEQIKETAGPFLLKHGFAYTFKTKTLESKMVMTCVIEHEGGHCQESDFEVPIENSGRMNRVQESGSSSTYAKRYALSNGFGIVTSDEDNDGNTADSDSGKQTSGTSGKANPDRQRNPGMTPEQGKQQFQGKSTQPTPAQQPKHAVGSTERSTVPAQATEKTRDWFLREMRFRFDEPVLLQYFCDKGPPYALMPNQQLSEIRLDFVPTTPEGRDKVIADVAAFMSVEPRNVPHGTPQNGAGASRPPNTTVPPASGASKAKPEPKKATPEPDHHKADWYQYPVPFGKHAGKMLGELEKNTLYGFWANFTVETEYNGKPKKKETIEKDKQFRNHLDHAGQFYKFDEPKGGSAGDFDNESFDVDQDPDQPPF